MSGIFEAFALLFTADTKKATDEVQDLDKHVDNLDQTVDQAQKKIKKLSQESVDAGESLGAFGERLRDIAAITLGYFAFDRIVDRFHEAKEMADKMDEFSEAIDANIEEVSAWGDATKMAGGSVEGFKQSLSSLARAQADVAAKGKSRLTPFFDELGIKLTNANGKAKTALDLLPDIQEAFSKIGKEQAFAFGQKIGLDDGTVMLLQKSRKELDELIERQRWLGVITKEQGQAAGEWNDELDDTDHAWRSLTSQLIVNFLPAVKLVNGAIQSVLVFLKDHAAFIEGATYALSGFAVVAGVAMTAIIATTSPMLFGIGLVTAGILILSTAIAAVYEDFQAWIHGGNSLLKDWLGDFEPFKAKVLETFNSVTDSIKGAIDAIKQFWHWLTHPGEALDQIAGGIKGLFGPLLEGLPNVGGMLQNGIAVMSMANTPLAGMSSAAMGASNITNGGNVSIGKVEVVTQATDAAGMARDAGGELNRQLRQVSAATDNGISH